MFQQEFHNLNEPKVEQPNGKQFPVCIPEKFLSFVDHHEYQHASLLLSFLLRRTKHNYLFELLDLWQLQSLLLQAHGARLKANYL